MARRAAAVETREVPGIKEAGEVAAVWKPIEWIKRWDRNPRINAHVVERVAASIKRWGFGAPLVCRSDGTLIAGDTRLQAALLLGLETVPVRVLDHITGAQAKALAIADNKLAEKARWSPELETLVEEMAAQDADALAACGFDEKELDQLLHRLGPTTGPEPEHTFAIVITCKSERHQVQLLKRLTKEGLECRALI